MSTSPDDLPQAVREAIAQGNKLEAIKRLRGATGLGLKDAKDHIDAAVRTGSVPLSPAVPRAPTASWWVAALFALLAAAWFVLR